MQLPEIIASEMSGANTDFVKGLVLQDTQLFEELIDIVLRNEEPVSRRAIWVLDKATEEQPDLMEPYVTTLFRALPEFRHDGLKRHTLRIINRYPIPETITLELMDICFKFLTSGNESVAVKLFAIHILYKISEKEPGIKPELAAAIEMQMPEGSPGMKNIGSKMLNKLYRELE